MIMVFLRLNDLTGSFVEKLKRIDVVGTITFIASVTGLLIPMTWGGVEYGWSSWHTVVPLVVSVAGLAFFVVWEERFASQPLIPFRITKSRTVAATYICTLVHGMVLWCALYYLPLYYEAVKGVTPVMTGVDLFPETFTIAPAAIAVGVIVTLTGSYRWSIWGGYFFVTLGFGLMLLLRVDTSTVSWILINLVPGLGCGMLFPGLAFSVQAATSEKDAAAGVTLFTFSRAFGQAIGVALGGVIFQNHVLKEIASRPLIAAHAMEWAKDASALVEMIKMMEEGPIKQQLVESYAGALRIVWAACCGFSSIGLIASFFIQGFSLDRALGSDQQFQEQHDRTDDEEGVALSALK